MNSPDQAAEAMAAPERSRKPTPPLKWPGGKRWLVPSLLPLWAPHQERRLVEPFCGGLAVALALRPQRALLNDINPHAINFYRWLKAGLQVTLPMRYEEALFYEHRATFNRLIAEGQADSDEAAQLFYYLNHTCYNGLCRFNRKGQFNAPFGQYKKVSYALDASLYREVVADWEFTVGDFESVALAPDDFVYADPPYDVEFRQYAKEGFAWSDQSRLAEWLTRHPGPVVLSNQATPRVKELYESLGYNMDYVDGPRRISCDGDRSYVKEVLAVRNV